MIRRTWRYALVFGWRRRACPGAETTWPGGETAHAYLPAAGRPRRLLLGPGQLALALLPPPTGLNYFYLSPAVTLVGGGGPDKRVSGRWALVMNLIGPVRPDLPRLGDFFRATHPTTPADGVHTWFRSTRPSDVPCSRSIRRQLNAAEP